MPGSHRIRQIFEIIALCVLGGCAAILAFAATTPAWHQAPVQGNSIALLGVTCAAQDSCFAVGNFQQVPAANQMQAALPVAVVEKWSGHGWRLQPIPHLTGSLTSISCPSSTYCLAVGASDAGPYGSPSAPVLPAWQGGAWQSIPATGLNAGIPGGAACINPTSCWIVWNGSLFRYLQQRWQKQKLPLSVLSEFTCGHYACLASGYLTPSTRTMQIAAWNGTTWNIVANRSDVNYPGTNAIAMSCPGNAGCIIAWSDHAKLFEAATRGDQLRMLRVASLPPNLLVGGSIWCQNSSSCLVAALENATTFNGEPGTQPELMRISVHNIYTTSLPIPIPTADIPSQLDQIAITCQAVGHCLAVGTSYPQGNGLVTNGYYPKSAFADALP